MYKTQNAFIILLLLLSASLLGAQSAAPNQVEWQKQVGADITPFITRVLNFGGTASSETFSFISRKRLDANSHARAGFGLALNINGGNNNITQGSFAMAFGKEKVRPFARRWAGYYGWEARLETEVQHFGNLDATNAQIDVGPAVFAGLYFSLNDHLVLSTEASLPIFLRVLTGGFGEGLGLNINWRVPTALYLSYRW